MRQRLRQRPLLAAILALFSSSLFGRVMGMVYRVALVRVAGQDTIGIVQLALPVYRIARSVATLGMPIAIAKITAERTQQAGRPDYAAYRRGLTVMTYTALAGFLVQALFSRFWAESVLADSRTEPAIVVLAALLLPIALTSALRGTIQGFQRQSWVAAADVLEVLCRIPVTLALVTWLAPYGPIWMAAGVAVGFIAGELVTIPVLSWAVVSKHPAKSVPRRRTALPTLQVRELFKLGLPLMVTGVLNNAMSLITVALIPRLLQMAGLTLTQATREYGRFSGMAVPTLYMPMMIIGPVVSVALPEITRLAVQQVVTARRRLGWLLRRLFLGTMVVIAVVIPLLWYQGDWLAALLYGDSTIGELIRPLAFAVPFTYLGSVAVGVLYGLGKTNWTMLSSMAGNALRIVVVAFLAGRPEYGIMGVLWAYIADSVLTAVLAISGLTWTLFRTGRFVRS